MTQFDNTVFEMNPDRVITDIDTPLARVSIIDNYYKDFDVVRQEMDKLPYALTSNNNSDMFDGRKSYVGNMSGTHLPFVRDHAHMVKDIIEYNGELETDSSLLINCNQILTDRYIEEYYNPHTDPSSSIDTISTVIMMNASYDESEGLNTYDIAGTQFPLWMKRTELKLNTFIQAKPNRAILFSALLPHGAAFNTSQYRELMRYTQVIFTHLV